jgi:hypothetical protein
MHIPYLFQVSPVKKSQSMTTFRQIHNSLAKRQLKIGTQNSDHTTPQIKVVFKILLTKKKNLLIIR